MSHVQKERFFVRNGVIDLTDGFSSQRLCQEDVLAVVGVQAWNVPDSIPVSPRGAEILSAEVASRSPCRMPSDVDVETDLKRIFGGC